MGQMNNAHRIQPENSKGDLGVDEIVLLQRILSTQRVVWIRMPYLGRCKQDRSDKPQGYKKNILTS
jgi:hypothetical protein